MFAIALLLYQCRRLSFEGRVLWCGYGVIATAAELTLERWLLSLAA